MKVAQLASVFLGQAGNFEVEMELFWDVFVGISRSIRISIVSRDLDMKKQYIGLCQLCSQTAPLRKSHIIPNWAWRELRGADGKVVDLNKSNMHSYALIERLLCERCEQLFSKWENVANGFGDKSEIGSEYGPWLLKFATSISWRTLKYQLMRDNSELSDTLLEIVQHPSVPEALDCWAQFLLHDRLVSNSKRHRQHLFLVKS